MTRPADEDIRCWLPECGQTIPLRNSLDALDYPRAKGWHILPVLNADRPTVLKALCPEHAGNQKRQTPPVNLEGQEPLF